MGEGKFTEQAMISVLSDGHKEAFKKQKMTLLYALEQELANMPPLDLYASLVGNPNSEVTDDDVRNLDLKIKFLNAAIKQLKA